MITSRFFFQSLENAGIDFFTGVPDSLLKDFCAYLQDNVDSKKHIIAANEGAAVALASGHYLATGKPGLVYFQNSGQGNTINPLLSLADPEVYSIPILLVIGWRGEPGAKDEPQHVKQGKATLELLEASGIPYSILPTEEETVIEILQKAKKYLREESSPYAIVVKKGSFETYSLKNKIKTDFEMNREDAIKLIVDNLEKNDIVISTTGKTSRELFEYREEKNEGHQKDFLTVGSMGHSSQIALGIALEKANKRVYCLDGDGAAIMHLGSFAIIGTQKPNNFFHILINNGAHDSVGGQPTAGFEMDFCKVAQACSYKKTSKVKTREELEHALIESKAQEGPLLIEVLVNKGARKDLGRPTRTPQENKEDFMRFLNEETN